MQPEHDISPDCWCNPEEVEPGVYAHLEVPLNPSKEMRMAGASRLASIESTDDWPGKFDDLQIAAMTNLAERVWRSMLLEWCARRHSDGPEAGNDE